MITLGVETSCDETSVALYSDGVGILASETFSQDFIHADFGGVIPEVASRNHILKIRPLFRSVMEKSGLSGRDIDLIGVTGSPGLIGALFVGLSFAKALGYALKRPVISVNHLAAHILAAELCYPGLRPPYLGLVISGGHTHIYDVDAALNFTLIGKTCDDAAGEAFDKVAKMLGGPYPGGRFVQKLAQKGDPEAVSFPIAFRGEARFSFSGLKTSVLNALAKGIYSPQDVAASFQRTVARTLEEKIAAALKITGKSAVVIGGGVACNSEIRSVLSAINGAKVFFPDSCRCTDNADMIAYASRRFFDLRKFAGFSETAADTKHAVL